MTDATPETKDAKPAAATRSTNTENPVPFARRPFPDGLDLGELYHENTKFHPHLVLDEEDPSAGSGDYGPNTCFQYLALDSGDRVPLPSDGDTAGAREFEGLDAIIRNRRSLRAFTGRAITFPQLARLLRNAYGYTGVLESGDGHGRAAPSAGARFPLEWFAVVRAVEGLDAGVYHYHPETDSLERIREGDATDDLNRAFFRQAFIPHAAVTFLVGAAFHRTTVKYRERGYRLILLDAGHASENLILTASAMGLGATGLGGFLDDELNRLVQLNGIDENVLYGISVGVLPDTAGP